MNIENKNPKAIQEEIYKEINAGADPVKLKQELKAQGVPVEAYYFTTGQDLVTMQEPPSSSGVSGWQVFLTIVSLLILIFRIARCSSRM